jgi:peptidoglycan hydrolase CwlO-like protein
MAINFKNLIGTSWETELLNEAKKLGAKEGSMGRPAEDTPAYDVPETDLRAKVTDKVLALQEKLTLELMKITPNLNRLVGQLDEISHKIEQRRTPNTLQNILVGDLNATRSDLVKLNSNASEAEGYYNEFRYINNVNINPDHPSDKLNYLSLIALIWVFEAVLNTAFWTDMADGFITKGLMMAFGIALINISIGFIAGIGFAHKNLNSLKSRLLGWGSFFLGILSAVYLNFYIVSNKLVEGKLSAEQFDFNNNFSKLMFVLGIIFALIALFKGYRFLGSVPGYENASKRYFDAQNAIKKIISDIKSKINNEINTEITFRNQLVRSLNDLNAGISKIEGDIKNMQDSFASAIGYLDQVLRTSVGTYRTANNASRARNVKSPQWFTEKVSLEIETNAHLEDIMTRLNGLAENTSIHLISIKEPFALESTELRALEGDIAAGQMAGLIKESEEEGRRLFEARIDQPVGNL